MPPVSQNDPARRGISCQAQRTHGRRGLSVANDRAARLAAIPAGEPRRKVDIAALLASVVDDMADAALPVTMTPAAPLIHDCQPGALKRALTNLLDNAVKYGKRAQAAIATVGNAIEIAIDDDGPGIPEAELARVFQPFYRVEDSRSRDTGGTGLGLAIAQSIVQAHGGELTLANRTGGGLRACIRLPV